MTFAAHFTPTTLNQVEVGSLIQLPYFQETCLAIMLDKRMQDYVIGLLSHSKYAFTFLTENHPNHACLSFGLNWKITPCGPVVFQHSGKTRSNGGALVVHAEGTMLNFKRRTNDQSASQEFRYYDLTTRTIGHPPPLENDVVFTSWEIWMPENPDRNLCRQSILKLP